MAPVQTVSKGKRLIIFDLDGTLTESKSPLDSEMSGLIAELLKEKEVAVISGGTYSQFEKQMVGALSCAEELLRRLYLFPACSTSFYRYTGKWENVYEERLTMEEREKIRDAFSKALDEVSFGLPDTAYGDRLEDRGTQMTFSALGQGAPIELKKSWDPDFKKRMELKQALERHIPEFGISAGGTTSLDVTRKGIDKSYGISQIEKYLCMTKGEMLFIGDALFEGGNDCAVKKTGVECIATTGPECTKEIIRSMLSS